MIKRKEERKSRRFISRMEVLQWISIIIYSGMKIK